MRQPTRKVRRLVQRLTDAQPSRVSLVGHGANQTPWNVVKSADPASQENTMKTRIHRIDFAAAKFPAIDAVQAFMADKGYGNIVIKAVEGVDGVAFAVDGHKADEFEGTIEQIVRDDGVTMHVGKLTADAEAAAVAEDERVAKEAETAPETENAEKAAGGEGITSEELIVIGASNTELVTKWNGYATEWSEGTTIASVMSDGVDGLPPGIYEINSAFYQALKNNFLARNVDGVTKVCEEFGTLIVKLAKVFATATMPSEKVSKAVDRLFQDPAAEAPEPAAETTKAPEGDAAPEAGTEGAAGASTEAPLADGTTAATETAEPAPEPAPADATTAAVEKAFKSLSDLLAPTLATMADAISTLASANKEAAAKTEAALAGVTENVTKAADRVSALEKVQQSRKGADANHTATGTQETAKATQTNDHEVVRRQALGSTLGFLTPRK